ncbi:MAG: hypothetical protein C4293_14105, partial [Nitrospiraceae bacterium]
SKAVSHHRLAAGTRAKGALGAWMRTWLTRLKAMLNHRRPGGPGPAPRATRSAGRGYPGSDGAAIVAPESDTGVAIS